MKNKKDDKFSYALGITLTFELLNFRPKDCVSVYVHSKFTDANSFEKLINLCKEKNIEYKPLIPKIPSLKQIAVFPSAP